jgi:hypothetical protein
MEEATGTSSAYQCCTFRGSVVALDSATGKQIWKGFTVPEAPRQSAPLGGLQLEMLWSRIFCDAVQMS